MPDKEPYHFSHHAEELIGDLRGLRFREPARMKKRPTTPLAPLIETLLVKYNIGGHTAIDTVREKWAESVGHANAAFSHPLEIDLRGRLIITVSHSVVRSELHLHRADLLRKFKALPGCTHIKELVFRAG